MKNDKSIDVFQVQARHNAIHARLINWANLVRVRPHYSVSPMFRGWRSNSRQWSAPEPRVEVDTRDGWIIEKTVCSLPERHRIALQWWYVFKWPSVRVMRQNLGVTEDGLLQICNSARDMVDNRLSRVTLASV